MTIFSLLKEASRTKKITCPKCDNKIEPDAMHCVCGWKNPLPEMGLI